MCTVSWTHRRGGYRLYANRDERHTRGPARPPGVATLDGVRCVFPVDGDAGGSWLGVNQHGLGLCLLNAYQVADTRPAEAYESRGLLLTSLLSAEDHAAVAGRLADAALESFRGFELLALQPGRPARLWRWHGVELGLVADAEAENPLVSSSFDGPRVAAARREAYHALRAEGGTLDPALSLAYHRSHEPVAGPYSVCMHRDDARTVSFSWVDVRSDGAVFHYTPDAPCRGRAEEVAHLAF